MGYLNGLAEKLNTARISIVDASGQYFEAEIAITTTVVADISSYTPGIIKIDIAYPSNFPTWENIVYTQSYIYIFYKDAETGIADVDFLQVNFEFLRQLEISFTPGEITSLYITSSPLKFFIENQPSVF